MIVVTFALPEESQDFEKALSKLKQFTGRMPLPLHHERGFEAANTNGDAMQWAAGSLREDVRVVHTGVGLAAAERAMGELLAGERPKAVVSSGFAGALDPRLKVADLVVATNFSSPDLAEACRNIHASRGSIYFGGLSSQAMAIESVADKTNLGLVSGSLAVDMETSAIAAACQSRGIPFLSVRAISDSANEPLPVPFDVWFDLKKQRPRAFNLVSHLAAHPGAIGPFIRFVRGLTPARFVLTGFLVELLKSEAFRNS